MKKTFITVLTLLALVGCGAENKAETTNEVAEVATEATSSAISDVAVVNTIYVMAESDIVKTEGNTLRSKIEKAQQKFAKKEQDIQNEMQQLAEKYQKGLITTRDAQNKEQELQKRAETLQKQFQKEVPALQEEEQVLNNRIDDLITRAIQSINADKKYKMILNASAPGAPIILDADESLNITDAVLAKVNELYKADKASKK